MFRAAQIFVELSVAPGQLEYERTMKPISPDDEEELFIRSRSGDEEAFLALYRQRQGSIYRFALHMSGSAATAEDITQEVFLALIRDDCGYDPEKGPLAAYLFGIARNLLHRRLESDFGVWHGGGRSRHPAEPAVTADPLAAITKAEELRALRRAVRALPIRYREIVVLCELEELDYAAAADLLGCAVGTVRSRLHRARALLVKKLAGGRSPKPDSGGLPVRCAI